jgi:hypothetical protein
MFDDLQRVHPYLIKLTGEKPQAMAVDTTGDLAAAPLQDGTSVPAHGRPLLVVHLPDLGISPQVGIGPGPLPPSPTSPSTDH